MAKKLRYWEKLNEITVAWIQRAARPAFWRGRWGCRDVRSRVRRRKRPARQRHRHGRQHYSVASAVVLEAARGLHSLRRQGPDPNTGRRWRRCHDRMEP